MVLSTNVGKTNNILHNPNRFSVGIDMLTDDFSPETISFFITNKIHGNLSLELGSRIFKFPKVNAMRTKSVVYTDDNIWRIYRLKIVTLLKIISSVSTINSKLEKELTNFEVLLLENKNNAPGNKILIEEKCNINPIIKMKQYLIDKIGHCLKENPGLSGFLCK